MEETTSFPFNFSSCDFPESFNGQFFVDTGISLLLVIIAMVNNGMVIFTSVHNKNAMRHVKYLNRIVTSLAISDFLFGIIGIPLSITYYYLSYTGQADVIISRNERWQLDAIWFVPNILTSSECLHVFLIVSFRFITFLKPFEYQEIHKKYQSMLIPGIWSIAFLLNLLPLIYLLLDDEKYYLVFKYLVIHGLHSAQLVLIAGAYTLTLFIISRQSSIHGQQENHEKEHFTKMVSAVILCMFVCYLPYIIEWHIDVTMVPVKESCEIGEASVIFSTISRHLLQFHSCLNPIIYATTVPAFKEKIKHFVCCRFRHLQDGNQSDETYPDGFTRESRRH